MPCDRRNFLKTAAALAVSPRIAEPNPPPAKQHPHGIYADLPPATYRPDLPEEVNLLHLVHYRLRSCEELLAAHGTDCDCCLCYDVHGLTYNLEQGFAQLDCNTLARIGDIADCPCCGQRWGDDDSTL